MNKKRRYIFTILILIALASFAAIKLRPAAPRIAAEEALNVSKQRFQKEGFSPENYEIISSEGIKYWEFEVRRKDAVRLPGDDALIRVDKSSGAVLFQAGE